MERFDGRYVLSVKELACEDENGPLWQRVYEKLDKQRIEKVNDIKVPGKRAACAGAGLLVQFWLNKWGDITYMEGQNIRPGAPVKPELQLLTLEEVLDGIKKPWDEPVKSTKNGKPYPNSCCFCFNLSHSEDLVVGAFSERELGIDIQYQKTIDNYTKIMNRFFSEGERDFLMKVACGDGKEDTNRWEEVLQWFYRLWTRKEAYGKLTGEGIAPVIGKDFCDLEAEWLQSFDFDEYDVEEYAFLKGYQVTCCALRRPTSENSY